jgi:hypothetical protein
MVVETRSAHEEVFYARDVYSSTAFLSLLIIAGTIINLWCGRGVQPLLLTVAHACSLVISTLMLAFIAYSRRQPRPEVPIFFCASLVIGFFLVLVASAVLWRRAGRPWETVALTQTVIVTSSMLPSRTLVLPALAVALFSLEAVMIHTWLLHTGIPPSRLIAGEPITTISFAGVALAVLHMRVQRRDLALRFLQRSADALTLRRLSGVLGEIASDIAGAAASLDEAMHRLREVPAPGAHRRLARAVEKITSVSGGLGASASRGALHRYDHEEREFYARDAHAAVFSLCVTVAVLSVIALVGLTHLHLGPMPLFLIVQTCLATVGAISLHLTRQTPSETFTTITFVLVVTLLCAEFAAVMPYWQNLGVVFEPFLGPKLFLVMVPLAAPRRPPWLVILVEVIVTLACVEAFYRMHMDQLRDRLPLVEPWLTVLYCMIGMAMLATRENRRVMSLRLLRADREVAALVSRAAVSLTLLDQLGSPLQTAAANLELLRAMGAEERALVRANASLARLAAASQRVPRADDDEALRLIGESFQGLRY